MTAVSQSIESRTCEAFTTQYLCPVLEWQIRRNHHAQAFVGGADDIEE